MSGALLTIDSPGLELVIPAGLLLAAVLPFLRQAKRQKVAGLVALTLALTAGLGYFKYTMDSRNDASRAALLASTPAQARLKPVTAPNNAYTSSQTCRACHPSEYKSWHNSYHRTMTQLARIAPLAKRATQIDAISERRAAAGLLGQALHAQLLLDAQGKPLEDVADRLTRQRDNRPITLQE